MCSLWIRVFKTLSQRLVHGFRESDGVRHGLLQKAHELLRLRGELAVLGTIQPMRTRVFPAKGMETTRGLLSPSVNSPLPVVKASVRARTLIMVERLLTLMHLAGFFKDRIWYSSEKSVATPWSCSKETYG